MEETTPIEAAHFYASAAEEYEEKDQWAKAMEAHFRAAEQFLLAMNYTSDPEATKTLKMMHTNHTRQGKELQRRLTKLKGQSSSAMHQQSSLQEKSRSASGSHGISGSSIAKGRALSIDPRSQLREHHGMSLSSSASRAQQFSNATLTRKHSSEGTGSEMLRSTMSTTASSALGLLRDGSASVIPGMSMDSLASSERTIGESYMVLKGTDDDDSDPFNKFWDIVESLVQKVSNPVAFATAPLSGSIDPPALLEPDAHVSALPSRDVDQQRARKDNPKVEELLPTTGESFYIVEQPVKHNSATANSSRTKQMAKKKGGSSSKTLEEYALENKQLKLALDEMSKRMALTLKAAEENSMLKSSILQFKNDFQKEAKRLMISQETLRSSSVAKLLPENLTVLHARIRELEDDLHATKQMYEAEKKANEKLQKKWAKLEQSAKKRRSNKQDEILSTSQPNVSSPPNKSAITPNTTTAIRDEGRTDETFAVGSDLSKILDQELPPSPQLPRRARAFSGNASPGLTIDTQLRATNTDASPNSPTSIGAKSNGNVGAAGGRRTPVPPTTTIVHATATATAPKMSPVRSREGSNEDGSLAFAFSQPQMRRQASLGSAVSGGNVTPPLQSRRESAPAPVGKSVYYSAPLASSSIRTDMY